MTLDFNNENGKMYFEYCFVGFVLGGSMMDKKGPTILRRELALFEKLESISEVKPCGKKLINGEPERQLVDGGQVTLDGPELDMLYNYVSITPWQTGTPVRRALAVMDWLTGANGRS